MDRFQRKLRLLIVTGSAVGFMGAWGLLAHAGKPVSNTDVSVDDPSPAAALAPIKLPPLNFNQLESGNGTTNLQPLPVIPDTQPAPSFRPRLRTRSS